jgi:hypothetical protein
LFRGDNNSGILCRENAKAYLAVIESEATKQSILLLPLGLPREACHRTRLRATRWLAMTLLIRLCK